MNDPEEMTEGTAEALEEMLSPRVDISSIAGETNEEKLNVIVFELYKEALSVVNLAAHILDETSTAKGGWPRNQAICAGLLIRAFISLAHMYNCPCRDRAVIGTRFQWF